MKKSLTLCLLSLIAVLAAGQPRVSQWELFEQQFICPTSKNQFTDVEFSATFTHVATSTQQTVRGFYDGDDIFRLRFMPTRQGEWTFTTRSSEPALDRQRGSLVCTAPEGSNRGLVIAEGQEFRYADGGSYRPVGTTAYAWMHADAARQEQTCRSLSEARFNKLRFCIFPNNSVKELPGCYPFIVKDNQFRPRPNNNEWTGDYRGPSPFTFDTSRFDVAFFQHLDSCVMRLKSLGIEADVILFTPYDGGFWGFDRLSREVNDRYLRYVVARLAAFSNVWWSMANEWNLVRSKTLDEWIDMTRLVAREDPYGHLLSIHGGTAVYLDYNMPLFTHASIQDQGPLYNFEGAATVRHIINKPVIFDEVCYEGNLTSRWAQLSGEEMLSRIWTGLLAGTYVTHGECFGVEPKDYTGLSFLATGGAFEGTCPGRIPFLRELLDRLPASPRLADPSWDPATSTAGEGHYLIYFGKETPAKWEFNLPSKNDRWPRLQEGTRFKVDIVDTWNMTTTTLPDTYTTQSDGTRYRMIDSRHRSIKLPKRLWLLLHVYQAD